MTPKHQKLQHLAVLCLNHIVLLSIISSSEANVLLCENELNTLDTSVPSGTLLKPHCSLILLMLSTSGVNALLCENVPELNDDSPIVRVKAMQNSVKPGLVFNII